MGRGGGSRGAKGGGGGGGAGTKVGGGAAEKAVEAVRAGDAELVGRGSEGTSYRVGDLIVKTHKRDATDLVEAAKVANEMRAAGVPGIPKYQIVGEGKTAATVRAAYTVPKTVTAAQRDRALNIVGEMHRRGFILGDELTGNVGLDRSGRVHLIDTGYAKRNSDPAVHRREMEHLRANHGLKVRG